MVFVLADKVILEAALRLGHVAIVRRGIIRIGTKTVHTDAIAAGFLGERWRTRWRIEAYQEFCPCGVGLSMAVARSGPDGTVVSGRLLVQGRRLLRRWRQLHRNLSFLSIGDPFRCVVPLLAEQIREDVDGLWLAGFLQCRDDFRRGWPWGRHFLRLHVELISGQWRGRSAVDRAHRWWTEWRVIPVGRRAVACGFVRGCLWWRWGWP